MNRVNGVVRVSLELSSGTREVGLQLLWITTGFSLGKMNLPIQEGSKHEIIGFDIFLSISFSYSVRMSEKCE